MRFDDLNSLKNPQGFFEMIQSVAQKFIGQNPVLSKRAEEVCFVRTMGFTEEEAEASYSQTMTELEVVLETEHLKCDKLPFILSQPAAKKMEAVVQANAPEKDWEQLKMCWAYMRLHKRVAKEQLLGWLAASNKFDKSSDLCTFIEGYTGKLWNMDKRSGQFITREGLSDEESFSLDLFQSSLPMVVPPRKVDAKHHNPYLVRKSSLWTKRALKHSELPYEAINLLNQTKYVINYQVWEKFKFHIELPEEKIGETQVEYTKRVKSVIREHWRKVFVLELFWQLGIKYIWIPGQLDHRGRMYGSQGGVFNTQGKDIDKGIFAFEAEPCSEIGQYWLSISIANCYNSQYKGKDLDKLTFSERYEWYQLVIDPLMHLPREEFEAEIDEILPKAESPVCFYAQVENMYAIWQALARHETPMVWSITHWDATSSGYQFQCLYSGDEKTGKLVNICAEDQRYDLYTCLKDWVEAEYGKKLPYSRKQLKQTIWIPLSYGAGKWKKELAKAGHGDLADAIIKVVEKLQMYGINRKMANLDKVCINFDEYQMYLPDGMLVAKEFDHHSAQEITLFGKPVHFELKEKGRGKDPETGKRKWSTEYLTVVVHSCDAFVLRELEYRAKLTEERVRQIKNALNHPQPINEDDPSVQELRKVIALTKAFCLGSYRMLHLINERNAQIILDEKGFLDFVNEMIEGASPFEYNISCIHDSFGVCPNYVDDIMDNYKSVMADIAKSQWLMTCVCQLTKGQIKGRTPKPSKEFINNILNSKYMLC